MIKAGTVLCPVCGRLFETACYAHATRKERLVLKRGLLSNAWFVEEYCDEHHKELSATRYELKSNADDGMAEKIEVRVNDGEPELYSRCCPYCEGTTIIPEGWGKVPSYVVCVVGLRGKGKTSLLTAMANSSNLYALLGREYASELKTPELEGGTGKAQATTIDSIGKTKIFRIYEAGRASERPVANVMFRDGAGELFNENYANNAIHRFSKAWGDYSGPDAFMLVHSATDSDNELIEICKFINKQVNGAWPITAHVLTHVDEVGEWKLVCEDGNEVPVKLQETFPQCNTKLPRAANNYYEREKLLARWALQDLLVQNNEHVLAKGLLFGNAPSRRFLVKSCEMKNGELNYDSPINVLDPAIWILNQLGLYSLRRVDE